MKRFAIAVLAGLLALSVAVPASAQTDAVTDQTIPGRDHDPAAALERIKAHADQAVAVRLETLDRLTDVVSTNEHVTDDHAQELLADYVAAEEGLTALNAEIQAAATIQEALELSAKIATDYRVYLVIVPKTHAVVVSDVIVGAEPKFAAAADEVQAAIDRAEAAGVDTGDAQSLLDQARDAAAAAADVAGPVAGSVIGLDATDWPEPAQAALQSARQDLHDAGSSLHGAGRHLRAAIEELRSALEQLAG